MATDFPPSVTPDVVCDMTLKLRLWLSDQTMSITRRREALRYLAALWPPHEEMYQRWRIEQASECELCGNTHRNPRDNRF